MTGNGNPVNREWRADLPRRLALAALLIGAAALAGCTARPAPQIPECVMPDEKPPVEGGIGGTGNTVECVKT